MSIPGHYAREFPVLVHVHQLVLVDRSPEPTPHQTVVRTPALEPTQLGLQTGLDRGLVSKLEDVVLRRRGFAGGIVHTLDHYVRHLRERQKVLGVFIFKNNVYAYINIYI